MEITVRADGLKGHRARALIRAKRIDRGEPIAKEITLNFADPSDMASVLTEQRMRLFSLVKCNKLSVTGLATALRRDPKSVRRDVCKLEEMGVLRTRLDVNPGHGRVKIVEPAAETIALHATL
jgi:predicted transcriptional regulator